MLVVPVWAKYSICMLAIGVGLRTVLPLFTVSMVRFFNFTITKLINLILMTVNEWQ